MRRAVVAIVVAAAVGGFSAAAFAQAKKQAFQGAPSGGVELPSADSNSRSPGAKQPGGAGASGLAKGGALVTSGGQTDAKSQSQ
jgi:hypothetical protein